MKRVLILLLSAVLMTAALTGCSSGEEDALVSKTPFPEFSEVDIAGDEISSDIFADYDATIVNFWNNGCGSCIAEMPELEELYQDFKERNINLIGVGTDSGESREQLDTAREILKEKGVTYHNISPDPEGDFYKDFVADISTYPTTYIVDGEGNIVGADIVGNVKKQLDTVETRLALIPSSLRPPSCSILSGRPPRRHFCQRRAGIPLHQQTRESLPHGGRRWAVGTKSRNRQARGIRSAHGGWGHSKLPAGCRRQ